MLRRFATNNGRRIRLTNSSSGHTSLHPSYYRSSYHCSQALSSSRSGDAQHLKPQDLLCDLSINHPMKHSRSKKTVLNARSIALRSHPIKKVSVLSLFWISTNNQQRTTTCVCFYEAGTKRSPNLTLRIKMGQNLRMGSFDLR